MLPTPPRPDELAGPLLAWFEEARRAMPWRGVDDPYRIWLSEIMLQQTQVATVIPYYQRFVERFPTVDELAAADEDEVLALWQGLGYYSRARNLQRAAKLIASEHGGEFPREPAAARALPGVGPYTTGAVLSIAYGVRLPAVDGNTERVLARVMGIEGDLSRGPAKRTVHAIAAEAVPDSRPGEFNQAVMELGSTLCSPISPCCERCPLESLCVAARTGRTGELPTPTVRPPVERRKAAAAIVRRRGRVLVVQRPPTGFWASLWEFPLVDVTSDGEPQGSLVDHVRGHLGLGLTGLAPLGSLSYGIMNRRYALTAYGASSRAGRAPAAARWVEPCELAALAMPAPHRKLAERIV